MHPADIKAALNKNGWTQKALAKKTGKSEQAISGVIHKRIVSDSLMRLIAQAAGVKPEAAFPEYYMSPPKRKMSKRDAD